MQETESDLGHIFLREFITKLVVSSRKNKVDKKIDLNEKISQEIVKEAKNEIIPLTKQKTTERKINLLMDKKVSIITRQQQPAQQIRTIEIGDINKDKLKVPSPPARNPQIVQMRTLPAQPRTFIHQRMPSQSFPGGPQQPIQVKTAPPTNIPTNIGGVTKINAIINDPAVLNIECTGPGKPILVNRSGITQTAPITLTADEIQTALSDISKRTKIPLAQGVFKAALDNIIVTAVISDFVGSRFILEKKNPLTQVPHPGY